MKMSNHPGSRSFAPAARPSTPGRGALALASIAGLMLTAAAVAQPPARGPATGLTAPTNKPQPAAAPAAAPAAKPVAPPVTQVPGAFLVSMFSPSYADSIDGHPGLPTIPELMDSARVPLVATPGGYDVPSAGTTAPTYTISEISALLARDGTRNFSKSALQAVLVGVRDALNARGVVGVWIEYARDQVEVKVPDGSTSADDAKWNDLRASGDNTLKIIINVATVSQVRTVASGDRIPLESRVNAPASQRIITNSPVAPAATAPPAEGGENGEAVRRDLLIKPDLDDYVLRLNRRPGRRVDVAVAPGEKPGTAVLDYLVRENNPLTIYVQGSNTGTKQTDEWRERFGLIHSQLTNNDDQLSLDYITGNFDVAHQFQGSYEFPFFNYDKLRIKVFGAYNEFDASEVGGSGFTGRGYTVGGEAIWNFAQVREWFFDAVGGARFQNIDVQNRVVNTNGDADFFIPRFGLNVERNTQATNTNAQIAVEFNAPDVADTPTNLDNLGRTGANRSYTLFSGNLEETFYLEPIFDSAAFERGESTLAHEAAFFLRGQTSFDRRVAPNFQGVIGGFYSVRGYQESEASGDAFFVATAEYRLHVPRLFTPTTDTWDFFGPFRYAPDSGIPYSRPDWDLILRAFIDVGRVYNTDRLSFERDVTLVGVGGGVELQVRRNLNIRLDVGVAAKDGVTQQSGDVRVHFVGTFLF